MKTLFCLLPFAFCLSASAVTPPMPPLPPGWKPPIKRTIVRKGAELLTSAALRQTTTTTAARFVPASVPSANGVLFDPFIYTDPDPMWGKLAVASAHQGTNTILRVKYSTTLTGERRLVTELACYFVDQVFWVSTTGNYPELYMWGENIPCTPTFQPAGAERLGMTLDFYRKTKDGPEYIGKGAEILGVDLPPTFKLWKKLP